MKIRLSPPRQPLDPVTSGGQTLQPGETDTVSLLRQGIGSSDSTADPSLDMDLSSAENGTTARDMQEVLVADVRGGMTPGQMVEKKLHTLLGRGYRGRYDLATGGPGHERRRSRR